MPLTYDHQGLSGGLVPSLDLGFTNQKYRWGLKPRGFSDIITFTRASGGGRFNAAGQYEWLANDVPRIDYDPVTKECKGLLIEEQRTNLLLYSSGFDLTAWTKTGAVVAGNAYTSPSGLQDACSVRNTPGVNSLVRQSNSLLPSTTYTRSVFAKHVTGASELVFEYSVGGSLSKAQFNLVTGTVVNPGSLGSPSATITPAGNGWYRCTHTFTTAASGVNGAGVFYIGTYGATATETTIALWGAQLEAGSFPTSYIPTTTAQVTRSADVASVNQLSPWYRADEGTVFVEAYAGWGVAALGVCSIETAGNPAATRSFSVVVGLDRVSDFANGGVYISPALPSIAANTVIRAALASNAIDCTMAQNGSTAKASMPHSNDLSRMWIGAFASGANKLNGHIRSVRYWPKRLSDAELQSLTA